MDVNYRESRTGYVLFISTNNLVGKKADKELSCTTNSYGKSLSF